MSSMSNYSSPFSGLLFPRTTVSPPEKVPEMPESMKASSPADILDAAAAINNSRVHWPVNAINSLSKESVNLQDWEVQMVEKAFTEFLAKYNSPLAKALK
jgi:hypothetical protein